MDHAWVPPDTDADYAVLRVVLSNRANTRRRQSTYRSVKEFFDDLETDSTIGKPTGDLLVGSHANNDGWIKARFAKQQTDETTYDEVIKVLSTSQAAFRIPTALHSGANPPIKFRLVGCQAGKTPEMLRVLKRVMGGAVPVVGSVHFYDVKVITKHGGFVTFRYGFEAHSPTQLKKQADLIALFQARAQAVPAEFTLIDNTVVDPTQWKDWVPSARKMNDAKHNFAAKQVSLGQTIGKFKTLPTGIQSRHVPRFTLQKVPNMPLPTSQAAGRTELKQRLPNLPEFAATHEFPFHRRKGCVSVDEFVDGYFWKFQQDATSSDMLCHGSRHDYVLLVPVKFPEPSKTWDQQRILFHFYPSPGTGLTAVTSDFTDDDTRIFVTV